MHCALDAFLLADALRMHCALVLFVCDWTVTMTRIRVCVGRCVGDDALADVENARPLLVYLYV